MKRLSLPLIILALFTAFFNTAVQAATVAYWRFEGNLSNETDTLAGAGGNLTATGSISTTALAGTGRTSDFFNPVPQTGEANAFTGTAFGSGRRLQTPHSSAFNLSTDDAFTIEALINPTNLSAVQVIAGQWLASDGQRAWLLVVEPTGQLRLRVSQNGIGSELYLSTPLGLGTIEAQKDYYVAASFATSGVTLYLQNLTDSGSLMSQDFAVSLTGIVNSTAPFTIGAYGPSSEAFFTGYVDEVRLSNVVLGESELLVVPEPSAYVLLAVGMAFVCARRRWR